MSLKSFFVKHSIEFDDDITNDTYCEYTSPSYADDTLNIKHRRNLYKRHIERWFNKTNNYTPFMITNDESKTTQDIDTITHNIYNCPKINHFLVNINKEYHYHTYNISNNIVYNRETCCKIYNDILETVLDSGYNIIDINQFKEDIIYFIYRLSKLE